MYPFRSGLWDQLVPLARSFLIQWARSGLLGPLLRLALSLPSGQLCQPVRLSLHPWAQLARWDRLVLSDPSAQSCPHLWDRSALSVR